MRNSREKQNSPLKKTGKKKGRKREGRKHYGGREYHEESIVTVGSFERLSKAKTKVSFLCT